VVGIIALAHSLANTLAEVQSRAEEVAPYVASMIQEELRLEVERRRLRETELLYDIASITSGSESVANLSSRVARELFASLPADQVSVHLLDSGTPMNVASVGANMRVLDAILEQPWTKDEDWELHLFDARADARIDPSAALKNRIGSCAVVPLVGTHGPIGLLVAASHTRGAIDSPQLESLRIAAVELSRAILRLEGTSVKHQGLMNPAEFAQAVGKDRGAFVFFEPIRRDHLVEVFGRTAVEHCLQKLARQIRQKLPDGGCICRRDQGDFLVFLPHASMDRAAKWANEICGGAALIPVRSVDGTASIPLALRSKVAEFDRQEHGVFDAVSA
jgi:GGDEF domain-containing protein